MKKKFLMLFFIACMGMSACTPEYVDIEDKTEETYQLDLQPVLSLSKGARADLVLGITYASIQGNPEISWMSSDPEIASVSSSKTQTVTVTGISNGTCYVSAFVGKSASASCRVDVSTGGSGETIVSSITVNPTEMSFEYNPAQSAETNSFSITAAVITNNGATISPSWSSSAEEVATVTGSGSSATVYVKKGGHARITAKAGGLSAHCELEAIDVSVPQTISVKITNPSVSVEEGNDIQINSVVSGGVAVTTVWDSNDKTVATVSETGMVHAVTPGSATISVTVTDADGNSDTADCFVVVNEHGSSDYDAKVAAWSKPGHVYFHYMRKKHDYDNWAIWAWQTKPKNREGSLWGASATIDNLAGITKHTIGFMKNSECGGTGDDTYRDEHGQIIDVNIADESVLGGRTGKPSPLVTSSSWDTKEQTLGFFIVDQTKMTGETNWESDGSGEIYIKDLKSLMPGGLTGSFLHVYCVQGNVANYTLSSGSGSTYVNPTVDDKEGNYRSQDDTSLLYKDDYPNGVPTSETFLEDRPGVGYQIFVPSFCDSDGDGMGDLRGIINKLDYLEKDVGAKVLWLTPIQESNSYHGYDVTDYYKIDSKFGTIKDYQELIFKCHQRGMKVLMDMVINHTSKSNVLFRKSEQAIEEEVNGNKIKYRDMYIWKFKGDKVRIWDGEGDNDNAASHFTTATLGGSAEIDKKLDELWYKDGESDYYYYGKFGSGMAELNYNSQATRDYMTDMCKYWLSFGLDGFRLDATKHIYLLGELSTTLDLDMSQSNKDIVWDVGKKHYWNEERQDYFDVDNDYSYHRKMNVTFWKQFAGSLKSAYPNCFLVGENFDGWNERMAPFYESMDSQFDFQTYFQLNQYYESGIGEQIKTSQETYYKKYRKNGMIDGAFTSNHDIYRLLNHAAQHDEDVPLGVNGNNHKEVNATNKTYAINMAKYYAAVTIFTPGISWIYYGDELGMAGNLKDLVPDSSGKPFNDHGNNIDRWYRQPMKWGNIKGQDGVVDYTFGGLEILWDFYNQQHLQSVPQQKSDSNSMLNYVKAACDIKNNKEYPTYGRITNTGSIDGQMTGSAYFEITDGGRTVCICINNTDSGKFYEKLNWSLLGGFGASSYGSDGHFTVPAHGFIVLKSN